MKPAKSGTRETGELVADPVPLRSRSWARLVPEASLLVEGEFFTPVPGNKRVIDGKNHHPTRRSTIHPLLLPDRPAPPWLHELAEAVAGLRLNDAGVPQKIERKRLAEIRRTAKRATEGSSEFWNSWRRWFFADPANRPIHPTLETNEKEAITALLDGDRNDLRQALRRDPGNGIALARLARLDLEAPPKGSGRPSRSCSLAVLSGSLRPPCGRTRAGLARSVEGPGPWSHSCGGTSQRPPVPSNGLPGSKSILIPTPSSPAHYLPPLARTSVRPGGSSSSRPPTPASSPPTASRA